MTKNNIRPILLDIRNLSSVRGGRTVLNIPEMRIYEGEILSLIGPNGAGKTTLLMALLRLVPLESGVIVFKNTPLNETLPHDTYRRHFVMVFQKSLLFNSSVFNNIAYGLRIRGIRGRELLRRVDEQMALFGIAHLRNRHARKISGGEARRVSLARAFVLNPTVVLLDEPFAELDTPTRDALIADCEKILRASGTTAIFATHDRNEALMLSDRISVMNEGRILQTGAPEDIMHRPANEFVASFAGTDTIISGPVIKKNRGTLFIEVNGSILEIVGEAKIGSKVTFCVRPENILLSKKASRATSARNAFAGSIQRILPVGHFYKVFIDCGFQLIAHVTHQSVKNLGLAEGGKIVASFKATAAHIIRGAAEV